MEDAIQKHDLEQVQRLLNKNTIDAPFKSGWTALLYACNEGNESIVDYLLKSGAMVNKDFEFFTPLMAVCNSSSREEQLVKCANSLIKRGADIDAMDKFKTTALMYACSRGHENLVSLLLDAGCKVNKIDNEGCTALHMACVYNFPHIAQTLLKHGANKNIKDRRGRSPLDIAVSKGAEEIIQMLDETLTEQKSEMETVYEKNKTVFENLLTQLPSYSDSSCKEGFHSDVEILLSGMRLSQKADLFLNNNVSLAKFLNLKNAELKDLGLVFSSHRERVIGDNKRFVMHPWGASTIPTENINDHNWGIMDVVRSLANTVKQLHIMWASSVYCNERVTLPADNQDPKLENFFKGLMFAYRQNNALIEELHLILKNVEHLERNDNVHSVDLIPPVRRIRSPSFCKILLMGAFCTFLVWKGMSLKVFRK